jgi:Pyruvate/2-oxoacid:ferredoxin oxidoreductase delta subunit
MQDNGVDAYRCVNCGYLTMYAPTDQNNVKAPGYNPIVILDSEQACAGCGVVMPKQGPLSTVLPYYGS